jgi:hypothetical protein
MALYNFFVLNWEGPEGPTFFIKLQAVGTYLHKGP